MMQLFKGPDSYVVGSARHEAHKLADWRRLNFLHHGKFFPNIRVIFHKVMPRCIIDMIESWPNGLFRFWSYDRLVLRAYNREMKDVAT